MEEDLATIDSLFVKSENLVQNFKNKLTKIQEVTEKELKTVVHDFASEV